MIMSVYFPEYYGIATQPRIQVEIIRNQNGPFGKVGLVKKYYKFIDV